MDNSIDLLSIQFWQTLRRHVVNKKVVSNLRVSIDAFAVGLGNPLCKDSGILRVKQQIDSCQLRILLKAIPVSCKHFSFRVIRVNKHWAPFSTSVFVFVQTLTRNRGEVTVSIETKRNPFLRQTAVIFSVIKGFKWQPVRWIRGSVAIINALNLKLVTKL